MLGDKMETHTISFISVSKAAAQMRHAKQTHRDSYNRNQLWIFGGLSSGNGCVIKKNFITKRRLKQFADGISVFSIHCIWVFYFRHSLQFSSQQFSRNECILIIVNNDDNNANAAFEKNILNARNGKQIDGNCPAHYYQKNRINNRPSSRKSQS